MGEIEISKKIIIDADGCPVAAKRIASVLGREYGVRVIHVASVTHWSSEVEAQEVLWVDASYQQADLAIIQRVEPGDIVITGDFGLAALVLSYKATALSPRGFTYQQDKIEELLLQRHLAAKIRRGGGRVKGPQGYSQADSRRFETTLRKLLD